MPPVAVALTIVICFINKCVGEFTVPSARFEANYPKGFKVSIPDVNGISLFGFHGSSTPIRSPQVAQWNRDVIWSYNGSWTYTNYDAELNSGDKIYYWTYVLYFGEGYRENYGEWTVIGVKIDQNKTNLDEVTERVVTTDKALLEEDARDSEEPKPESNSQIIAPALLEEGARVSEEPKSQSNSQIITPASPKRKGPVKKKTKADETVPFISKTQPLVSGNAAFKTVKPVEKEHEGRSQSTLSKSQPISFSRGKICEDTFSEVQNKGIICSGDLLFESNFKELSALNEMWTPEVLFPQGPDFPFVVYMNDTLSLNNGHLAIKPILLEEKFGNGFTRKMLALKGCTGEIGTEECERVGAGAQILPPVVSGKLTTKNTFSFKYGKIEVRAKFPKGNWILPEMLLEPRDNKYGASDYSSGVMKIASTKGNDVYARQLVGGVIMHDKLPFRSFGLKTHNSPELWNNDFHNYTLVWMPDRIYLYVDGHNYGNIQETESFSQIGMKENIKAAQSWANGNKIAPFDQLFYISLGVQVGGAKVFLDTEGKPWVNKGKTGISNFWKSKDSWVPTWSSAEFRVESVRVYAI